MILCAEFACSPCVFVGFFFLVLRLPSNPKTCIWGTGELATLKFDCEGECLSLFVSPLTMGQTHQLSSLFTNSTIEIFFISVLYGIL